MFNEDTKFLNNTLLLQYDLHNVLEEFKKRGILDLKYLLKRLKRKDSLRHYSAELNLPLPYLTKLRTYLKHYVPNAKSLSSFPFIDLNKHTIFLKKLESIRITNSYHLLKISTTNQNRINLSKMTDIPLHFIMKLVKYSDLFRCGNIKPELVKILINAKIESAKLLSQETPEYLFSLIEAESSDQKKLKFSLSDTAILIISAKRGIERIKIE